MLYLVDEDGGSKNSHDDGQWARESGRTSAWWSAQGSWFTGRFRGGSSSGGGRGIDGSGRFRRLAGGSVRRCSGSAGAGGGRSRGGRGRGSRSRSRGSGDEVRGEDESVRVVIVGWGRVVGDSDGISAAGWEILWNTPGVGATVGEVGDDCSNWLQAVGITIHNNQGDLFSNRINPLDIEG